jgi:cobyrinic acid a,c-diamide synthase
MPGGPRVAVAGGRAFTFHYAEHTELLEAAGAEVVVFDPLVDEALPAGVSGLIIGGGFPEAYAGQLSANEPMRRAVAAFVRDGGVIAAECAGLLYLTRSLDGAPMCDTIPADAAMTPRLALGYREATACSDSPLAVAGAQVRGHEFHRTALTPHAAFTPAWHWAAHDAVERPGSMSHGARSGGATEDPAVHYPVRDLVRDAASARRPHAAHGAVAVRGAVGVCAAGADVGEPDVKESGARESDVREPDVGESGMKEPGVGVSGVRDGFVGGRVHASYLHVHPAGYPEMVVRYVAACAGWERS